MIIFFIVFFNLFGHQCGESSPDWSNCSEASDCAGFKTPCGLNKAFNKKFIARIADYNKCMGPLISCPQFPQKQNSKIQAVDCFKNKCIIVAKEVTENDVRKNLPRRCSSDDQCTKIFLTNCCSPDPINIKYFENYRDQLNVKMRECAKVNCMMLETEAVCLNNRCEIRRK